MNKLLISLFSVGILSLLVIQNNNIFAQSNEEIINGFLQNIELTNDKILLSIVDNEGNSHSLSLVNESKIGIETQSGERWIGNINDNKEELIIILLESQKNLEAFTITSSNNIIINLVSYESSNIKNNLQYLGASFILLIFFIFGFVFIMNNRIKIINSKLKI
jgi:hypothetical protein|tara:strand:+ start:5063 stop:5551 length:489 start_codon:yes stop_codon:yes gene_type:complete